MWRRRYGIDFHSLWTWESAYRVLRTFMLSDGRVTSTSSCQLHFLRYIHQVHHALFFLYDLVGEVRDEELVITAMLRVGGRYPKQSLYSSLTEYEELIRCWEDWE